MLRIRKGKLRWHEADVIRMERAIGPDLAEVMSAPFIPSLAKLAIKLGVRCEPEVVQRVEAHGILVRQLRDRKKLADAAGFPAALFPHQRADLAYMQDVPLPAYLLAHQPGVGKTPEAIMWLRRLLRTQRILVVCPNSAKEQWADEIRRWDPEFGDITIVGGTIVDQIKQISDARTGWVIGHWESLVFARIGYMQRKWDGVIADEAQFAQNRRALRTKTLFALARRSQYRMALSGHPFANDPTELYSLLRFLYPLRYKSYWRFFYMYAEWHPEGFGKIKVTGTKRPNLLKWEIAPFTLRRTKRSLGYMPPTRQRRVAYLPSAYRTEYRKLEKQMFVDLEGRDTRLPIFDVLARNTRLRQWLIDPGLIGGSRKSLKYPLVVELMKELDGPPVIFTMFRQAGERLIKYLAANGYRRGGMISGKFSTAQRRVLQKNFLAGKLDYLVVQVQAGGVALNLGKYGYVIHLDLPWNHRDFEQTEGRVDRPEEGTGRIVPVTSWRIVVKDSFEDHVMEPLINNKFAEFGKVFSVDKLKELLSVR